MAASSRLPIEEWVASLPMEGSLEQRQRDCYQHAPLASPRFELNHAPSVPLPESRPDSPHRSQDNASSIPLDSDCDSEFDSGASHHTALPSGAKHGIPPAPQSGGQLYNGTTNTTTMYTASVGSCWRAQNALPATNIGAVSAIGSIANVPLPDATHSEMDWLNDTNSELASSIAAAGSSRKRRRRGNLRKRHAAKYWEQIQLLYCCLPHLGIITKPGRRSDSGIVTSIDYVRHSQAHVRESWHVRGISDSRNVSERIQGLRTISDPEILTRMILVEDLSPLLIDSLGFAFQIDPEFFAEHLNRSGYAGVDYSEASPVHWKTHTLSKAHASMKWYRPVQQNPEVTEWLKNPATLLDWRLVGKGNKAKKVPAAILRVDPELNSDGKRNVSRKEHKIMVRTNIFRPSWPLSTRSATRQEELHRSSKRDFAMKTPRIRNAAEQDGNIPHDTPWKSGLQSVPAAWEERATCFRYEKACVPISMYHVHTKAYRILVISLTMISNYLVRSFAFNIRFRVSSK